MCKTKWHYLKLHVLSFGFAFGIIGAIWMFILGLFSMKGYGVAYVALLSSVYPGFSPSFLGSVLGAFWGFIGSFVFAVLVSALYNGFVCKCGRKGVCGTCNCEKCKGKCKCNVPGEVCEVHTEHKPVKPF